MTVHQPAALIRDRRLHTLMGALPVLAFLLLVMPSHPTGGLVDETLEILGCFLLLAGVLGRTWCTVYVGGRKKKEVVATGPYSVVRNPLYLASLFSVVGIGLLSGMVAVALALPVIFVAYYSEVIRREEAFLAGAFGAAYHAYLRRVPRWMPNLRLWHAPKELVVRPKLIGITMRDSSLVFLALPVFEGLKALHDAGILPALLTLP